MVPSSRREVRDIYVVFKLMESHLHQVIKANDDLTHEHHRDLYDTSLISKAGPAKEMHTLIERVRMTIRGSADDIGWLQRAAEMPPVEDGTERFMEILDDIRYE
ncbi:GPI-anchored protein like [Forsythia ovata]|uniref:GPI-anchored protein like n=1 Tax=Forsythia ovata TaxID=205694 RepID=A0ABD1UZG0_9LAMI